MHRDTAIRRPCRWVLPRILRGGTNSSTAPQTNAFQTRGHVTVGAIVITFIKQFTGNTSLTSNRKRTDAQFFEERTSSSSTSTILDPFLKNIYICIRPFMLVLKDQLFKLYAGTTSLQTSLSRQNDSRSKQ